MHPTSSTIRLRLNAPLLGFLASPASPQGNDMRVLGSADVCHAPYRHMMHAMVPYSVTVPPYSTMMPYSMMVYAVDTIWEMRC